MADKSKDGLSVEEFKQALPRQFRGNVSKEIVSKINSLLAGDDVLKQNYRDNLLSYGQVLRDGKFKLESYLNAVRYVSYKMMGLSNQDAYAKTFPDRMATMISQGTGADVIATYVHAFNKTKLVNMIFEQTLIPAYVLNADVFQKAINMQAVIMSDPKVAAKVRSDAANSLMTHLKPPETSKIQLDIGPRADGTIQDLKEVIAQLAANQKRLIESGVETAEGVAKSKILPESRTEQDIEIEAENRIYAS